MRRCLNRPLAPVLIALLITGCSTTKHLPREEFEAASKQPLAMHVVSTTGGEVYRVRSFSVTDSTFVIKELTQKDEHRDTAELPIVLPLADVSSVEMMDARPGAFLVFVPVLIVIGLFLSLGDMHLD